MSKNTEPTVPLAKVLSILGTFLAMGILFIVSIFVDKPASTVTTVTALVLLVVFFILCYRLGKFLENQEKAEAIAAAKVEHPSNTMSTTYSVFEPTTDTARIAEGSRWTVVDRSGKGALRSYVLTDNTWVESPITNTVQGDLDVSAMSTVDAAAEDVAKRTSRGDYGKSII